MDKSNYLKSYYLLKITNSLLIYLLSQFYKKKLPFLINNKQIFKIKKFWAILGNKNFDKNK
jgi:hypothetical protein